MGRVRVLFLGFGSGSGIKKVGFFPRVLGFRVPEPIMIPGTIIQIAVTPTIIDIDPNALHFDPLERECYLDKEFDFNFLPDYDFSYQMSNCLFEAMIQETNKQCNCSALALGPLDFDLNSTDCYGTLIKCEQKIFCNYI